MEAHPVLCEVGTEVLMKYRLILLVSLVSFNTPMSYTHLHINTTVIRRTSGRNLRNFKITIFRKKNKIFSVFKCLKHIRTFKHILKNKAVPLPQRRDMKTYDGMEVSYHAFLTLELKLVSSMLRPLYPQIIGPCSLLVRGYVKSRACMDVLPKK